MNRRTLRKVHRWLGLIAGIQLLAWTLSGLYFTLIPIEEIRGNHLLPEPAATVMLSEWDLLSPQAVVGMNTTLEEVKLSDITLTAPLGTPEYLIKDQRFSAETGQPLGQISATEAEQIVQQRTPHNILSTELIKEVAIDSEYRGGDLPAWRIQLDTENAAVYVVASSGHLRAVRTDAWRLFDFLWSLHIMDYEERDDFNHLLIQFLAVLGLITVVSGLALFVITTRWRRLTS